MAEATNRIHRHLEDGLGKRRNEALQQRPAELDELDALIDDEAFSGDRVAFGGRAGRSDLAFFEGCSSNGEIY